MKNLERFTMTAIVDYYTEQIIGRMGVEVNKETAKQLFLNALAYNVVREEVLEQVAFLVDND